MNQVIIDGTTYQVPGAFNELSPRQLRDVVRLLHSGRERTDLRLRLALVVVGAVSNQTTIGQAIWFKFSDEQRHQLLPLADFCLEEPKLTRQLLPELQVGKSLTKLKGPGAAFCDLQFSTFIEAEGLFVRAGRDAAVLDKFVALLYNGTPEQAKQISTELKLAVLMWYTSCRKAWAEKYSNTIFDTSTTTSVNPRDSRETWREILAERAGSPVHYEEYGRQPLPNVLFDLDLRIRRRREAQPA